MLVVPAFVLIALILMGTLWNGSKIYFLVIAGKSTVHGSISYYSY